MFALLEAFGVIVVEAPRLDVEVCYVQDRHLGVLRAGLAPDRIAWCADWLLAEATRWAS